MRAERTQAAPELGDRPDPGRGRRRRSRSTPSRSRCRGRTSTRSRPCSPIAGNVRPASPVRIAGVNVGKVTAIEHLAPDDRAVRPPRRRRARSTEDGTVPSTATVVTMELEESALPLHTDATMKLRPRLFLEGNLFVDLQPGSPNAPGGRRRPRVPGRADRRGGPARPGPDHAPGRRPDRPPDPARPVRQRVRQARRRGGPARAVPVLAWRVPLHVAGERGAPRTGAARPLRPDREPGLHGRGARAQRGRAPGPGHEPADRARLVRGRERGPRAGHRRAAGRARGGRARARRA